MKLSYFFHCAVAMLTLVLVLAFLGCTGEGSRLKAKSAQMQGDSYADHHTSQKASSSSFHSISVAELEHLRSNAQAGVPKSLKTWLAMVLLALNDPAVALNSTTRSFDDLRAELEAALVTTNEHKFASGPFTFTMHSKPDGSKTMMMVGPNGDQALAEMAVDGSLTNTMTSVDGSQEHTVFRADESMMVQTYDASGKMLQTIEYGADGSLVQS